MRGFTYKGKHSLKDYNIVAKSVERPILPALRKKELTIPGRHGSYDFGSNTYGNRPMSILLQYDGNTVSDMRLVSREIVAWLSSMTYEPLVFDDEPDKYYQAKIYDQVGLETFSRLGIATVKFECQPFALHQVSTGEDVLLDSDLPLDSDTLLNPGDEFTFAVSTDTTFDINYIGTQEVGLGSPVGSKFDIVITGSFTTLSITLNGKAINYNANVSGKTVIINNVDATIKTNDNNTLFNCTGDLTEFLKLIPGTNTVTITGTGLNCSVLFDFRPQYL